MKGRQRGRLLAAAIVIVTMLALAGAVPAIAQSELNLQATKIGKNSITVSWNEDVGTFEYIVEYRARGTADFITVYTSETSFTLRNLHPYNFYLITVSSDRYNDALVARTRMNDPDDEASASSNAARRQANAYRPPDVTCPNLPDRVVVIGYAVNSQCQMVDAAGVGRLDLIARGFIDAVDVWSYVNGGLEICFRNQGWLVFLDAAYSPRMLSELAHHQRDGMTCGNIDRAGTVVLLATAPSTTATTVATTTTTLAPAGGDALPLFQAVPLSDCRIKLVETLFLRAAPGGQIIGLVWLNSEVPVFEIHGYWYKIEFEGQVGYISRYYRKVLRGGCG